MAGLEWVDLNSGTQIADWVRQIKAVMQERAIGDRIAGSGEQLKGPGGVAEHQQQFAMAQRALSFVRGAHVDELQPISSPRASTRSPSSAAQLDEAAGWPARGIAHALRRQSSPTVASLVDVMGLVIYSP